MTESFIIFFYNYGYYIAVALLIIKLVHYLKNKRWSLAHFLLFSRQSIDFTTNRKRKAFKKLQNMFTYSIIGALALQLLFHSMLADNFSSPNPANVSGLSAP